MEMAFSHIFFAILQIEFVENPQSRIPVGFLLPQALISNKPFSKRLSKGFHFSRWNCMVILLLGFHTYVEI